jgi:hypothetical protein
MTLASVILVIAVVLIVSSMLSEQYAKQCVQEAQASLPPKIQYVPTSIYEEQLFTPDLAVTYNSMFNNSDLWDRYPFTSNYSSIQL